MAPKLFPPPNEHNAHITLANARSESTLLALRATEKWKNDVFLNYAFLSQSFLSVLA